jgi:uncharacterized protein YukE
MHALDRTNEEKGDGVALPVHTALGGDSAPVAMGKRIGARIREDLRAVREMSESAVFTIGETLTQVCQAATNDDSNVRRTLQCAVGGDEVGDEDSTPIVDQLRSQSEEVAEFVRHTRSFLSDQIGFAKAANRACDNISSSATFVSDLMVRSRILALNMQIEAARLGQQGAAFNVIAEEMKHFALEVRQANESIKSALDELLVAMPKIEQRTSEMDGEMETFSHHIDQRLSDVQSQTQKLADCMQISLDSTTARNEEIVGLTQKVLSALQFQDPTSQTLRRVEYDINKLQSLLDNGTCEDVSLAEIEEDVGDDGSRLREAGAIELF